MLPQPPRPRAWTANRSSPPIAPTRPQAFCATLRLPKRQSKAHPLTPKRLKSTEQRSASVSRPKPTRSTRARAFGTTGLFCLSRLVRRSRSRSQLLITRPRKIPNSACSACDQAKNQSSDASWAQVPSSAGQRAAS
eukprot:scaffold106535_cov35-Tisochrysis_lutea.AAC.2